MKKRVKVIAENDRGKPAHENDVIFENGVLHRKFTGRLLRVEEYGLFGKIIYDANDLNGIKPQEVFE